MFEKAGEVIGAVTQCVEGDLRRFKDYIETRRDATGAWRGTIKQ